MFTTAPPQRAFLGRFIAVISALLMCLGAPAVAWASPIEFSEGHIDAFTVTTDGSELSLGLKEDVTGLGVMHAPEDVVLRVSDSAYSSDLLAQPDISSAGYLLPLTQSPGLIWPGWDTLGVAGHGFGPIDLVFEEVSGPGAVFLFSQKNFSPELQPLLQDGRLELRSGSVRRQEEPAHVHAYWLFTEPGTYRMKVYASGEGPTGAQRSATRTYTWVVGNSTAGMTDPGNDTPEIVAPAPAVPAPAVPAPANPAPAVPAPAKPAAPHASGSSGSSGSSSHGPADRTAHVSPISAQAPTCEARGTGLGLQARLKDDTTNPATWRDPQSLAFILGDAARSTAPAAIGNIPAGTPIYSIGATQVQGVPWLGANTMDPSLLEHTTGEVTWSLTSFSGPGSLEVFTSGSFGTIIGQSWFSAGPQGTSGQVTIPRNTHVHPNWVFSAPGTYRVGVRQQTTGTSGKPLVADTLLTFEVGTAATAGATQGHFDLGAVVVDAAPVYTTADGQPCTPGAAGTNNAAGTHNPSDTQGLANTSSGGSLWTFLFAAVGFLALGAALLFAAAHGGWPALPKAS